MLLSGEDKQCRIEGVRLRPVAADWRYIRDFQMTARDNYRLCIVIEFTERWPITYVASVLARNARLGRAFVAAFAAYKCTTPCAMTFRSPLVRDM